MRPRHLKAALCLCVGVIVLSCNMSSPTNGSGTETGNVRGVVVTSDKKPVKGAQVSLFKKRSAIASPNETAVPIDETICDENGNFSFDADGGNYTIIAHSNNQYSFLDDVLPGSESAKNLEAVLKKPGGLKGIIENTIELRGTGSVVVHILGTDIYQNVSSEGTFSISEIPAGKYRIVSYTTYQPEFTPLYDTVTIYSDSITDLGMYQLPYNGIPIPKGINVAYDTATGIVKVTWNAVKDYDDFQEYVVLRGVAGNPEHNLQEIAYTQDTFYIDTIVFSDGHPIQNMEYAVKVRDKLGDIGKYYGIYQIETVFYEEVLPLIDNVTATFDTAGGFVTVRWGTLDSADMFPGFGGYMVFRSIAKQPFDFSPENWNLTHSDTLGIFSEAELVDTVFPTLYDFANDTIRYIRYIICVYNEQWDRIGKASATPQIVTPRYDHLVPEVGVDAEYDTLSGVVTVNWDTDADSGVISGYNIFRIISNYEADVYLVDTFYLKKQVLKDTIYPNIFSFDDTGATTLCYTVQPIHAKWNVAGLMDSTGLDVRSYKFFKPVIRAGNDQGVDATEKVHLAGTVVSNTFPISKMEWMIGNTEKWTATSDGKHTFTPGDGYETEVIRCQFRVTDSVGNYSIDTCLVTKSLLQVTFSLPGRITQGSITANLTLAKHRGMYYFVGEIDNNKLAVWSSEDLRSWTPENRSPGFNSDYDDYSLLSHDDNLMLIGIRNKLAYTSSDGKVWKADTLFLEDSLKQFSTGVFKMGNTLYYNDDGYGTLRDLLYESRDGIHWSLKTGIDSLRNTVWSIFSFDEKLCIHYGNRALSLDDDGKWKQIALWDEDNGSFPDDIQSIMSDDSVLVAIYTERPSQTRKAIVYKDGIWYSLPLYGLSYNSTIFGIIGCNLIILNEPLLYRIKLY